MFGLQLYNRNPHKLDDAKRVIERAKYFMHKILKWNLCVKWQM